MPSTRPTFATLPVRTRLPHVTSPGLLQFVTIRLFDSVPEETVEQWKHQLKSAGTRREPGAALERLLERYGDAGHGDCWLARPPVATIVRDALFFQQPRRYQILAWCIMPNHVHTVLSLAPDANVTTAIRDWKSRSSRMANRELGRRGTFWMPDFFDRVIRNDRHLGKTIDYIESNPVKAGLADRPSDWPWSSATPK